jgi:hypothetical protein
VASELELLLAQHHLLAGKPTLGDLGDPFDLKDHMKRAEQAILIQNPRMAR